MVSRVSEALDGGDTDKDCSGEEDLLDDDNDDEMSANEGPEDSMTLVQYQNEA